MKKKRKKQRGAMLMITIVFTALFGIILGGLTIFIIYQNRIAKKLQARESALQVAEAGINYYRWHLAHDGTDYANGTADICTYPTPCGPYTQNYTGPNNSSIGTYELYITPPITGSTVVTIKSKGWITGYPNQSRTIEVQYGIPSLAMYSFLTNNDVYFETNENIVGPVHSNGGIRMDGTNNSKVTSSQSTYTCSDIHCPTNPGSTQNGVWGTGPNSNLWEFPTSLIDFNAFSLDLEQIKTDAQANGIYYDTAIGGAEGYRLVFKKDGTFDVYIVDDLMSSSQQYNDNQTSWINIADQPDNQTFIANQNPPSNGLIFIKDNVWVEGMVNGRYTVVAAKLNNNSTQYPDIIINNNITYTDENGIPARDGTNSLGLIAEKNIKVGSYAPTDLTIDAIMMAQNGRIYYNKHKLPPLPGSMAGRVIKNSITVYGSIITNKNWTWSWSWSESSSIVDGYTNTSLLYDRDAIFYPPPSFPTTGAYTFISWEEKVAGEL